MANNTPPPGELGAEDKPAAFFLTRDPPPLLRLFEPLSTLHSNDFFVLHTTFLYMYVPLYIFVCICIPLYIFVPLYICIAFVVGFVEGLRCVVC